MSPLLSQRERHPLLWYADGTVILATPTVIFRVYRGILAKKSPVFNDMFTLLQSISMSDQDITDGTPIVHLHDDSTEQAHLLSTLHDSSSVARHPQS